MRYTLTSPTPSHSYIFSFLVNKNMKHPQILFFLIYTRTIVVKGVMENYVTDVQVGF